MGRQSDSNVERTLGHVEPTMGGVVTPEVELTNTYRKWLMKMTQSRMSPSGSSDSERILEVPEPDGLGKGFTL